MTKTLIIAEAGINHDGNISVAKDLVYAAKEAGADVVKFQSYHTDLRVKKDNPAYDILKKCELNKDEQMELINYSKQVGIEFCSTAFDYDHLLFLTVNGINRIKLASFDITNKKFLKQVNDIAKMLPTLRVLLSTGMSNCYDLSRALECVPNVSYLTLLYCVSAYPIKDEKDLNLSSINTIKSLISGARNVGFSNHHKSSEIPAISVAAGAKVVEAHFMIHESCVDAPVSLDISMFKDMVSKIRRYENIMGDGVLGLKEVEKSALIFRRVS